jgi:nucleoporin NUP1
MKRVRSDSQDTYDDNDLGVVAKLAKLKNRIFSVFTKKEKDGDRLVNSRNRSYADLNDNDEGEGMSTPTTKGFSFQRSQSPITARQLEDYYNSLRKENEALADSLNNSAVGTKGDWTNAESTNIDYNENQDDGQKSKSTSEDHLGNNKNDDNDNNNEKDTNHGDIILIEDEGDKSSTDFNDGMSIDEAEQFGMTPLYSQPDPLERANLVQLKKMMELEKYRRYRLSYMREHTRHLNRHANKSGKNVSNSKQFFKLAKKIDVKNLPIERRNKTGTFGISLLDTVNDKDDEDECNDANSSLVKPLDSDPAKKLRFTKESQEDPAANFQISSKTRSFKESKDEKKEEEEGAPDVVHSKAAPIPSFTIPTKPTTSVQGDANANAEPSVGFKFSAPKVAEQAVAEKKEDSKPTLSFGLPKNDVTKPLFSFGGSAKPKELSKPTFTSASEKPIIEDIPDEDGLNNASMNVKSKSMTPVPKFQFKKEDSDKPAVSQSESVKVPSLFGSSALTDKPLFGAPSSEKKEDKPAFSFGTPASKTSLSLSKPSSDESKDTTAKPAFSFGTASTKPALNFGFGSGSKPDAKTEDSKVPALNFGTGANCDDDEKPEKDFAEPATKRKAPGGGFGSNTAVTGGLTFGKPAAGSDVVSKDDKPVMPTFNFGGAGAALAAPVAPLFGDAKKEEEKPEEEKAALFTFGSNNPVPALNIGSGASTPTTATSAAAGTEIKTQPSLLFGSKPMTATSNATSADTKSTPAPAFNFGANATTGSLKLPGASTSNGPAASGFNFSGSANATSGNNTLSESASKPSSTFKFGAASDPSATNGSVLGGFGSTANGNQTTNNSSPGFTFGTASNTTAAPNAPTGATASNAGGGNTQEGKLFSFSSSKFPPLNAAAKPVGFGGMAPGATNGFSFGTANVNNNASSAPSLAGGFGMNNSNSNSGFGANNNANSGFGSNNNANNGFGINNGSAGSAFGLNNGNAAGGFGMNNNNMGAIAASAPAASGFNFGSNTNSATTSNANSRSGTPNFNFTGQSTSADPAAIFGSGAPNTGMGMGMGMGNQPGVPGRKKAYPRSMRRR